MTDKIGIFRILIRHAIKKPPPQNTGAAKSSNRQVHGSGIAINIQGQAEAQQPRHHALQRHRRHKLVAFALNVELKSEQNKVVLRDCKT